jgi:hypothetical protein
MVASTACCGIYVASTPSTPRHIYTSRHAIAATITHAGRLAVLDANLQQLQLLIPGMSAGGAGLFSQECTSKVTICNRSKDWAEIASITKGDVMTLCENNEVRHWFEEAAHQENFLVRAAAKRSPSEESVEEDATVAETPTWRQQLRHFEKHKKQKKMDHVRDAIAAFSTYDMHDMVEAPEVYSPQRSVSSGASSPAARRRAVSK